MQACGKLTITDREEAKYVLHVADNNGASSSILPFAMHTSLYPEIAYCHDIKASSATLESFVQREKLNLDRYQALVLDTQGSEMMVLKGAVNILDRL